MTRLKKLIFTLSILLCNLSHADPTPPPPNLVDLNSYNPDICRHQILTSRDPYPVIMTYFHDCGFAKMLMPIFEEVAKEHPERMFYRFDYEYNTTVLSQCLDKLGALSPQLSVIALVKDPDTGTIYRLPPLKVDGSGYWKKDDIVKFIDVSDRIKSLSYQHTRHAPLSG